jgi:hypothetical protein
MTSRRRETLIVVELPLGGRVVDAPPLLLTSTHTVDYCCGSCGTVLMHANDEMAHSVRAHCSRCGSYNSGDGFSD